MITWESFAYMYQSSLTTVTTRITLDFNARVNGRHIDLFKIWSLVTSRGGYDAVSSEKLAWRRIGNDFNLGATNAAAYAFALKTLYYKNLVSVSIWLVMAIFSPSLEHMRSRPCTARSPRLSQFSKSLLPKEATL